MRPHPARLLICGYLAALALAMLALPGGGWGQVALAVWLVGPLLVLGLAMVPGINRAFLAEREGRAAPAMATPAHAPDVPDADWLAAEHELRMWERDLAAEDAAALDRLGAPSLPRPDAAATPSATVRREAG